MRRAAGAIVSLLLACLLIIAAEALVSSFYTVHNQGNVKAIGLLVFTDRFMTTPLTVIDWGWT